MFIIDFNEYVHVIFDVPVVLDFNVNVLVIFDVLDVLDFNVIVLVIFDVLDVLDFNVNVLVIFDVLVVLDFNVIVLVIFDVLVVLVLEWCPQKAAMIRESSLDSRLDSRFSIHAGIENQLTFERYCICIKKYFPYYLFSHLSCDRYSALA